MNTLRKIYCRAFQKAFHIAIPFLPYRKPKIAGSVKELPEIIMRHKCTHVLIITDGGIMKLGLTRRLEKALKEAGIPYTIYDKTVANPTTVNVREALELYHKEGCDASSVSAAVPAWTVPSSRCLCGQTQSVSGSDEGNPEGT